jgi:hypothetical protein
MQHVKEHGVLPGLLVAILEGNTGSLQARRLSRRTCFSPVGEGDNRCFGGVIDGLAVRTKRDLSSRRGAMSDKSQLN